MVMSAISTTSDVVANPADRPATLPPWPWDPFDLDAPRTLGWGVIAWIEGLTGFPGHDGFPGLIQPNGPRAGRRLRLTQDQQTFILWWYAVDDEARWLYQHAVKRRAKGTGKSPEAAVLSLAEFCGPVRFERFDDRVPGGCRGRSELMPWVQIAATAESQTKNTMRMVRALAGKRSPIVDFYNLDPGKTIYYRQPEGTLEVITSSYAAAEGAESSFVVADETEHWRPANSGPELAETLADNLAKSGARMLETSNAWVPGEETVAESTWDAWQAQEEGRTKGETGILYDARIAPPDIDLSDPAQLLPALEWVYGDCDWKKPHDAEGEPIGDAPPDVRPIAEKIWSLRSKPDESRRKYLNRPTTHANSWDADEMWPTLADLDRKITPDEPVVMFFDGSKSRDATALIGCAVEDGHVFTIGVWEPDPAHDTADTVSVADVDLTVRRAFDDLNVVGFFGDVVEWESFVKVEWPALYADRLKVQAVEGGKDPQPIAWDMRTRTFQFTAEVELTLDEMHGMAFTHDGDARVARHVSNCRVRPNRYGESIGKESRSSPLKIDAAVCVVGARMVRRLALAAGAGNVADMKSRRIKRR